MINKFGKLLFCLPRKIDCLGMPLKTFRKSKRKPHEGKMIRYKQIHFILMMTSLPKDVGEYVIGDRLL